MKPSELLACGFKGRAKRLDDIDLPVIGKTIGVGEDEIHAVIEVESSGGGFDSQGRLKALFEPHWFAKFLTGAKLQQAVNAGLAYHKWGEKPYPKESYTRIAAACEIDETAALKATSWGMGQVMGFHYAALGYKTVQDMVQAFADDEQAQLEGMITFIKINRLDDELRAHNWAGFARGYNGPGYAKNRYDTKLAAAFAKWQKIRDTPMPPSGSPGEAQKPAPAPVEPPVAPKPAPAPVAAAGKTDLPPPPNGDHPIYGGPVKRPSFWDRLFRKS